ncbi:MAG: hypothetical protein U0821_11675 [Chloroflexota bacterium]
MTGVLATLTIIYALILVVVLAATLVTILFYARRIGTTLAQIGAGLTAVQGHTAPLTQKIDALNEGLGVVRDGLAGAAADLASVDGTLGTLDGTAAPGTEAA